MTIPECCDVIGAQTAYQLIMLSDPVGMTVPDSRRLEIDLAIYNAQRAHELELNRVSAGLELSFVSPILLLNGAAAVAFLTLIGTASSDDARLHVDLAQAKWAAGIWCLGLLLAAFTVGAAHESQRNYTRATRARRVLFEEHLYRRVRAQDFDPATQDPRKA